MVRPKPQAFSPSLRNFGSIFLVKIARALLGVDAPDIQMRISLMVSGDFTRW
jgi:hypothetical protein